MHDAVIIGAGIAGAAIAHELRQRGQDILVVESGADIASGASGNPKGMIKPWLSLGDSAMRQFYTAAYHHALTLLEQYPDVVLQRGILQLPKKDEMRFRDAPQLAGFGADDLRYLTAHEASELMQTEILSDALFWPRAAVIDPAAWIRALLGNTPVEFNRTVKSLSEITARQIYLTTGFAMDLLPEIQAQIRPRTGQMTTVNVGALPQLPHAVSFGHYMIPSRRGENHIIGATYEHEVRQQTTMAAHEKNISALMEISEIIPAFNIPISAQTCGGRTSVRATTANHMPLWGTAGDNLFYLTGLGSRGLMSASYAAQQLLSRSSGT